MQDSTTVTTRSAQPHRVRRWAHELVDGAHPWGALHIGPVDRTGRSLSYRLIVFPPGLSETERRVLVLRGRWPALGTAIGLAVSALLGEFLNGWAAVAIGAAVVAAGFLATLLTAGDAAARTVRMSATVFNSFGDHEVFGDLEGLQRAASVLLRLDEQRRAGLVTPVDYELVWGRVYAELAETR